MLDDQQVILSPSKVADLASYFTYYPQYPLSLDLLIDFMLHTTLVLPQAGYGEVWSEGDIEKRSWKKPFEDLINLGAAETPRWYLSREQEMAVLQRGREFEANVSAGNIAFFFIFALEKRFPLLHRPAEIQLVRQALPLSEAALATPRVPADVDAEEIATGERSLYEVARFLLNVQVPSLFARRAPETGHDTIPGRDDVVWIDPDELVAMLRDRTALAQLRSYIAELATRAQSDIDVNKDLAAQRRQLERSIRVGDFSVSAIGLAIEFATAPFIHFIAPIISKLAELTGKSVSDRIAGRRHRWLLMTDEIERVLSERG
jgi:hypothetical protein